MSFQLEKIVLYNLEGEKRVISFERDKINIIQGTSKTGKSIIINIIEYCLGKSSFKVPNGIIKRTVSWFGVLYSTDHKKIFVAKPSPKDAKSQSSAYLKIGDEIEIPDFSELILNSNDDSINSEICEVLGIERNIHIPPEGQSRLDLESNLSHTHFYLFQKQTEINDPENIFHRQKEPFMPLTIRDTLRYLIGALSADYLKYNNLLRRKQREKALLEKKMLEAEMISKNDLQLANFLISEAKDLGFFRDKKVGDLMKDPLQNLRVVLNWNPEESLETNNSVVSEANLELSKMKKELEHLDEEINFLQKYHFESDSYSKNLFENNEKLKSINLFKSKTPENHCPFCKSKLERENDQERIFKLLKRSTSELQIMRHKNLKIDERLNFLKDQRLKVSSEIRKQKDRIYYLTIENNKSLNSSNLEISKLVGKVSLYLESVELVDDESDIKSKISSLENEILQYETILKEFNSDEHLENSLNEVNEFIEKIKPFLPLEHKDFEYYFDIDKLDLKGKKRRMVESKGVMIEVDKIISLKEGDIGSGENWLLGHLMVLLGVHSVFVKHNRPVPRFLVLDQAFQGFYPREDSVEDNEVSVKDSKSVSEIYQVLEDFCENFNFQIILLEHVKLKEKSFENRILEKPWTGEEDRALVPNSWDNQIS